MTQATKDTARMFEREEALRQLLVEFAKDVACFEEELKGQDRRALMKIIAESVRGTHREPRAKVVAACNLVDTDIRINVDLEHESDVVEIVGDRAFDLLRDYKKREEAERVFEGSVALCDMEDWF